MMLKSISSFVFDMPLDIKQGWFLFYLATERHRKHGKRFIGLVAICFGISLYSKRQQISLYFIGTCTVVVSASPDIIIRFI
jgi:hypothetical protein